MPKKSKVKITPCIITSRESMESSIAEIIRLKLEHAEETAAMEKEIAAIQADHQDALLGLASQIEAMEAGALIWCLKNRDLFKDKKSLDFLLATVGFRTTPHRVEKCHSKETWTSIARRLEALEWGSNYIRQPDPLPDKDKLLADRGQFTSDQLKLAGIRFEQDEDFFIKPKSEILDATSVPVAA